MIEAKNPKQVFRHGAQLTANQDIVGSPRICSLSLAVRTRGSLANECGCLDTMSVWQVRIPVVVPERKVQQGAVRQGG